MKNEIFKIESEEGNIITQKFPDGTTHTSYGTKLTITVLHPKTNKKVILNRLIVYDEDFPSEEKYFLIFLGMRTITAEFHRLEEDWRKGGR